MKKTVGMVIALAAVQAAPAAAAHGQFAGFSANPIGYGSTNAPVLAKSKAGHCPPGLAKKAVPCVPPGQAKRYRVGDYINGGYDRIKNPGRWGLPRNGYYVQAGDYVYEVDKDTHEVLNLIGAIADVLN